jgi:1-deoxy-D-xylulose-5-phosphate synthase
VKPLDTKLLHEVFSKYGHIVIYEEGALKGGVGSAVLEFSAKSYYSIPIDLQGIPDRFISHGNSKKLLKDLELDVEGICKKLNSISNKN